MRRARGPWRRRDAPRREGRRASCATWPPSWTGWPGSAARPTSGPPAALSGSLTFTGRLEHEDLADLLPAVEAQVVPSTFPEAFGMVAAEAAVCGALPVSAGHSGLAEVSEALAAAVPPEAAPLLSFPLSERAVEDLAERLVAWLEAPEPLRAATREALVAVGPRALLVGGRGPRGHRRRPGPPGRAARPLGGRAGRCALALAKRPHLRAVAADVHGAPHPRAVAGVVVEGPAAGVGPARLQARPGAVGHGGAHDPQQAAQRAVDSPRVRL